MPASTSSRKLRASAINQMVARAETTLTAKGGTPKNIEGVAGSEIVPKSAKDKLGIKLTRKRVKISTQAITLRGSPMYKRKCNVAVYFLLANL